MNSQQATNQSRNEETVPDVVLQALGHYPKDAQAILLEVREIIFSVQESDSGIGQLTEALRWGELSYLTEKPKTGSTIRLALTKSGEPAVFFHCRTTLVETFRSQYSHVFEFEGNRALLLRTPIEETVGELSHCIQQALRYKSDLPN